MSSGFLHIKTRKGIFLMVLLVATVFFVKKWYRNTSFFPVEVVAVSGQVHPETKNTIEQAVGMLTEKGFFSLSLSDVQTAVKQSPWVHTCKVRRVWPGRFELEVVEKVPIARFGKTGLIEANGEVFFPKDGSKNSYSAKFVLLEGPIPKAKVMMDQTMRFMEELSPLGLRLMKVNLENNGAWSILLSNGITIILGTEGIEERLARFKMAYIWALREQGQKVKSVDLRYTNSVAVAWQ